MNFSPFLALKSISLFDTLNSILLMKVSITSHTFHLENTELLQYTDLPSVDMLHTIGKNSLISSSVSQGKFWEAVELMVVSSSFYSVLNFP